MTQPLDHITEDLLTALKWLEKEPTEMRERIVRARITMALGTIARMKLKSEEAA